MNYLVTGSSGFLGKYIVRTGKVLGHQLTTIGRNTSNEVICDLSKKSPVLNKRVDIVVHAAGKAHELGIIKNESLYYDVNVKGTKNLLRGIENSNSKIKQFIFISSVSVYGQTKGENIQENAPLNGSSPYAKSKIEAEKLILNWGKENKIPVLIFRLPLVLGTAPKGNLQRLIKSIKTKTHISLNGGKAKKSMILASDVVQCIYDNPNKSGIFNLTDGYHPRIFELENKIAQHFNTRFISIPVYLIRWLTIFTILYKKFPITNDLISKLENNLTFSNENAMKELQWTPKNSIDNYEL